MKSVMEQDKEKKGREEQHRPIRQSSQGTCMQLEDRIKHEKLRQFHWMDFSRYKQIASSFPDEHFASYETPLDSYRQQHPSTQTRVIPRAVQK